MYRCPLSVELTSFPTWDEQPAVNELTPAQLGHWLLLQTGKPAVVPRMGDHCPSQCPGSYRDAALYKSQVLWKYCIRSAGAFLKKKIIKTLLFHHGFILREYSSLWLLAPVGQMVKLCSWEGFLNHETSGGPYSNHPICSKQCLISQETVMKSLGLLEEKRAI